MTIIKSSEQGAVDDPSASVQPPARPVSPDAISAPLARLDLDDSVPIAAELNDLEGTLVKALDAELETMVDDPRAGGAGVSPIAGKNGASKNGAGKDVDNATSHRALELQRKKAAANAMRQQLQDGADLLSDLLGKNEALISYLSKSEQELAHLEAVERRSKSTRSLAEDLLREHKSLGARYKEQNKRVEVLEAVKTRNRASIEKSKTEIDRLRQQLDGMRHDCETKDVVIAALDDNKAQLTELSQGLQDDNRNQAAKLDAHMARIGELEGQLSQRQIELTSETQAKEVLLADKEKARGELDELTVRFQSVSDANADLKAQLDEKTFEMESRSKAYEEAVCIKDARIKELEFDLIALKKTMMAGDRAAIEPPQGPGLQEAASELLAKSARGVAAKPKAKAPKSKAA